MLKTGDVNKAIEYVRRLVAELRSGKVPVEKLVIWKTLSKRLDEYEAEAPHVVAAKRMIEAGYKVQVGEKIGYVIVKGSGRVSSRAWPYFMVKPEQVDVDYYIDHQIVPAAMRILGYFGISEKQLKAAASGQRTLFDFLAAGRKRRG